MPNIPDSIRVGGDPASDTRQVQPWRSCGPTPGVASGVEGVAVAEGVLQGSVPAERCARPQRNVCACRQDGRRQFVVCPYRHLPGERRRISRRGQNRASSHSAELSADGGADEATLVLKGRAEGDLVYFEGTLRELPGSVFRAVMTPIDDEIPPALAPAAEGGIVNGLYAVEIRMLDGL